MDTIGRCLADIESRVGRLSALQKILLGTDGSVTKLLESATGHQVAVRTRLQEVVQADALAAERLGVTQGDAVNHRIVELLDATTGEVLVFAKSQTPLSRLAPEFRDDLMRADIPIGKIIERHHIEARREILTAQVTPDDTGGSFTLCRNEPLLMRQYRIIHGGKPLIFIQEQFPFNQFLDERRVIVEAPSRIHVTLIDMHGGSGRVDGGAGFALDDPCITIEARMHDQTVVTGCDPATAGRVKEIADSVLAAIHAPGAVALTVRKTCPAHNGLGSGSQLALAAAKAICELYGHDMTTGDLARLTGRGGTSGIGTAAFDQGGFIVDGGHRFGAGKEKAGFAPSSASRGVRPPPVIGWQEFPRDWQVLLAIPDLPAGASGAREADIFRSCCPVPLDEVRALSHEVLMRVLPGIAEHDLDLFGSSVNTIQTLGFKRIENSLQPPVVGKLLETMRSAGAAGAGLSSFGPACYGIYDTGIREGEHAVRAFLEAECGGGTALITSARNTGARVRAV